MKRRKRDRLARKRAHDQSSNLNSKFRAQEYLISVNQVEPSSTRELTREDFELGVALLMEDGERGYSTKRMVTPRQYRNLLMFGTLDEPKIMQEYPTLKSEDIKWPSEQPTCFNTRCKTRDKCRIIGCANTPPANIQK